MMRTNRTLRRAFKIKQETKDVPKTLLFILIFLALTETDFIKPSVEQKSVKFLSVQHHEPKGPDESLRCSFSLQISSCSPTAPVSLKPIRIQSSVSGLMRRGVVLHLVVWSSLRTESFPPLLRRFHLPSTLLAP